MLLEQCPALPFGHASPHTELDAVVQRVGAALGDHGAMAADHSGFALSCSPDEEFIGVRLATPGLRNPRNTGFCLSTLHNGMVRCIRGGTASRGLD